MVKNIIFILFILNNFFKPLLADVNLRINFLKQLIPTSVIGSKNNPYSFSIQKKKELVAIHNKSFCGIKFHDNNKFYYQLKTFDSVLNLNNEKYLITHEGNCGTCSTMQDLAVYIKYPNLTKPIRKCSRTVWLKNYTMRCYKNLGFTHECAETWYYNAMNTAKKCFFVCMKSWMLNEKFNVANGELNNCLKCDEEISGPVFKFSAGRTRRNSGLKSAISRPDEEISKFQFFHNLESHFHEIDILPPLNQRL